ncbi:peroxisomal membrane protein Pex13p [Trichomonascus vanleenenianus]|uniref:peroxin PEX13 n=1 Tax=Trichomonascus vanleenenianus TaxID=2268995 RepID=UPI003EC9D07C
MSVPRTKPWEVSSGTSAAASSASPQSTATTSATTAPAATTTSTSDPALPARPTSLTSVAPVANSYGNTGYNGYGSYGGSYGSGGYGGGMYGSSMYGSGMYGSGMYGGYGSYGRYGGGMGGMGYGMGGMGGMGMNPQEPGALQQSTAATFQLIESIVGAVGGFAQMLESTYMATHSSFFAMMSVAEQFGHLKNSLGSILGIFAIMRWAKRLLARLTGQPVTADAAGMTAKEFAKFSANGGAAGNTRNRPSFKPLLLFLAAVFGFPYLLGKLIRSLAVRQESHQLLEGPVGVGMDPSTLEFCRAVHDFVPENPQMELELRKGDLVAILTKKDPMGNDSQWWKARTRDGRTGYVPSTYVDPVPRRIQEVKQIKDIEEQQQANVLVEEFQSKVGQN